jgi:hypothetical protein
VGGWVGVYTKSKSSELSPLRRKLLRFAKQFPPPLRSNKLMPLLSQTFSVFTILFALCTAENFVKNYRVLPSK